MSKKNYILLILILIAGFFGAIGIINLVFKLITPEVDPNVSVQTERVTTTTTIAETPYTAPAKVNNAIPTYSNNSSDKVVDFDALQAENPDIYAWIYIKGTYINYPVVQSETDDSFYMDHNSNGDPSSTGAIFSEKEFNTTDFSDPVTVLYGHHVISGSLFGNLQKDFTNDKIWENDPVIEIYLPDRMLQYRVFAALPYDNSHIIANYDFNDDTVYENYFRMVFEQRSIETRLDPENAPVPGDKVLVLSSCVIGDNDTRYLVMGKLVFDSSEG